MLDLQGYGHLLLSGSVVTIKLALTSLVIGLVLGLLGAIAKLSGIKILQSIATTYTTFCAWYSQNFYRCFLFILVAR